MEALLNIDSVASSKNLGGLRQSYDTIETHIRSLCSLGVPSKSYGTLLSSIVMNKIPHDLRLIISREITEEEWDLDHVLKTMQSELEARERAGATPQPPASKHQQRSPCSPGTAAALFTNNSSPNCTYCRSPHPSSNCTTVANIDARKDVLRKSGRCFICLRRNHISRACRSNARCYKCGGRHPTQRGTAKVHQHLPHR